MKKPRLILGSNKHHEKSCKHKVRHATTKLADQAVERVSKEKGYFFDSYYCQFCKGYHLTRSYPKWNK